MFCGFMTRNVVNNNAPAHILLSLITPSTSVLNRLSICRIKCDPTTLCSDRSTPAYAAIEVVQLVLSSNEEISDKEESRLFDSI